MYYNKFGEAIGDELGNMYLEIGDYTCGITRRHNPSKIVLSPYDKWHTCG
jgi:hypothetical protein